MTRYHVTTARRVDPETGEVSFSTTQTPFTAEEEAAADVTLLPTQDDYTQAIQAMVDATAKAKNYTDGNSCVSYVDDTINPQWAKEAAAFKTWRSEVWAYAFMQLALVQGGKRTQPSVADFLSELPVITWPG